MGKYQQYERKVINRPYRTHPIWRGIGCVLMIIIPIIAFATSHEMANGSLRNLVPIPNELRGYIQFPDWVWRIPAISPIVSGIANYPNPWAVIVYGIVIIVIMAGIFTTVYSFIYKFLGPPRYTHLDAPPPRKPRGMKKVR